jgi:hypothetical protein
MAKTFIDYMTEEDYARYNELITLAEEAKAAAPKAERKPRGPLTVEQKRKAAEARLAKAQAALEALLAAQED